MVALQKASNFLKCLIQNIAYFPKRVRSARRLNLANKKVVLFYLPNKEIVTGGILSAYFLMEKSQVILNQSVVIPVVLTSFQRIFNAKWFKNPYFIYNFCRIKHRISKAEQIVIHIPECYFGNFCNRVRYHKLEYITQRATINILNQNADAMPPEEVFERNKYLCGKMTMTLAFAANMSKTHRYLDLHQMVMSAWFYHDENGGCDFQEKEDICIISSDEHPLKAQVVKRLEERGLRCIEIRNMPFDDYRALRAKAKWSVTFGEGYDGYWIGTILDGGMGFGVDDPKFRPLYIDPENLPYCTFSSYEELLEHIVDRMNFLETSVGDRETLNDKLRADILASNSPQIVVDNLRKYYETIGFLD